MESVALSIFRTTRPFFAPFLQNGAPVFHGVDKRLAGFDPVVHFLSRGSTIELANRNWRTVTKEAEDFGTCELFEDKNVKK